VVAEASAFFQLCGARRHKTAFVPGNAYRPHTGAGRKIKVDERYGGTGLIGGTIGAGLDAEGAALVQFQRPEGRVQMVASKVADSAGAKLPPGAPADRGVVGMIRTDRHGFEPALPIKACGYGRRLLRPFGEICPAPSAGAGPGVHIVNIADCPVPYPFAGKANVLAGMSEVAELGSDAGLAGGFGNNTGLIDGAAEGLFTIKVFTLGDNGQGNHGVRMVRGGEKDSVNVFLIEHLIVVVIGRAGLAIPLSDKLEGRFQSRGAAIVKHAIIADLVNIAKGSDTNVRLIEELLHIDDSLAARADNGDVDLFARGDVAFAAEHVARHNAQGRNHSGTTQEIPPAKPLLHINGIGFSNFHTLSPFCIHPHFGPAELPG